jgi:hypothetical protein
VAWASATTIDFTLDGGKFIILDTRLVSHAQ